MSFFFSRLTRKFHHWGQPYFLSIEPTNFCNLRCPECPTGCGELKRRAGNISLEELRYVLKAIPRETFYINLSFQGEPFINPFMPEIIEEVVNSGRYAVLYTNGHFIDDEVARKIVMAGLHEIVFALDGYDQESYMFYRDGGSFLRVTEAMKSVKKEKMRLQRNRPFIVTQTLYHRKTTGYEFGIIKLAQEAGADISYFKTMQIVHEENLKRLLPDTKKQRRYSINPDSVVQGNSKKKPCFRMWSGCVITWEGEMVPCCYDKDAYHKMGNVLIHPFSEIWKGKNFSLFRERVLTDRQSIKMCNNCNN